MKTTFDDGERRHELSAFLKSMRARIRPEEAGLPAGSRRRVPGLKREEIASLAGISATWYVWLEQGRKITPSRHALERLASALQLSEVERAHLVHLARPNVLRADRFEAGNMQPGLEIVQFIHGLDPHPAYALDPLWNVTAWNKSAEHLLGGFPRAVLEDGDLIRGNILMRLFLDEDWRALFVHWDDVAHMAVAQFRAATAAFRSSPARKMIIERLQEESQEFKRFWDKIELAQPQNWRKTLCHPSAGRLTFNYAALACDSPERGCFLSVYVPASEEDRKSLLRLFSEYTA